MNRSPIKSIKLPNNTDQEKRDSERHKQKAIKRDSIARNPRGQSLTTRKRKPDPHGKGMTVETVQRALVVIRKQRLEVQKRREDQKQHNNSTTGDKKQATM